MQSRRMSLLALALIVPAPTAGAFMGFVAAPGPVGKVSYTLAKLWILALPLAWLWLVEGGRLSLSRPSRGGFLPAAALGLLMSGAIYLAYHTLGGSLIDVDAFREFARARGFYTLRGYLSLAVPIVFFNSLLEEYVWRWFVFRRCEDLLPGFPAILASALLFTLHHIVLLQVEFDWPVAIIGSLGVFTGGAIWSFCYLRYRSIWPGYLSHAIADGAILSIGYRILSG